MTRWRASSLACAASERKFGLRFSSSKYSTRQGHQRASISALGNSIGSLGKKVSGSVAAEPRVLSAGFTRPLLGAVFARERRTNTAAVRVPFRKRAGSERQAEVHPRGAPADCEQPARRARQNPIAQ